MLRIRLLLLGVTLAVFGSALPGCGSKFPETFPVTGTVTLDGKPVSGAAVVFTPDEGRQATGTTDDAGRFELSTFELGDGALPGKHRVTVAKTTVDFSDEEEEKVVFLIPQKYGNLSTSELTSDVQEEMGPVQFDLISEPEPEVEPEEDLPPAEVVDSPDSGEPSP